MRRLATADDSGNASPIPSKGYDLVGPTVDDDLRRLTRRYGADEVRAAFKRQTANPLGRPSLRDWPDLRSILESDARSWLDGSDPFIIRSNRSIALAFAASHREQSHDATRDRIMRKLRASRRYFTLVEAERLSEVEYPHAANLRAIRELQKIGVLRQAWDRLSLIRQGYVADYISKFGEPPAEMTMQELTAKSAEPIPIERQSSSGNFLQGL